LQYGGIKRHSFSGLLVLNVTWGGKTFAGVLVDSSNQLTQRFVHWFETVIDLMCLDSSLALHFSDYSFHVHHPVNQDDRHLLAHAMASDFSVAWPFSQ
jgi:chemotaxis regulatin CheY-phosphate phosphatase CheZ